MTKNIFKFVIAISLLLFSNTYAQTFLSKQNPIEKIGSFYFESVSDIISSLAKDFDSTLAFYKPLFLNTVNVYSISANNIYDSVKLSLNRVSDLGNLYIRGFNRSQESAIFAGVSSVNIVAGIGDGVLAGVTKSLNSAKDAIVLTIYSTNKIGELVLNGLDNASGSTIYAKRQIENIFASIDSKGTDIGKNFALAIKSKNNINDQNTYVTRNKKKLQRIELTSSTSSFWNGLIDKISDPLVPLFVEKTKVTKSVVEKENSNPKENSNQSEIIRKENVVNNPSGNIVNNYYTNNYLSNSDLSKLRFEYLSLYKNLSDSINTRQLGQTEAIYRSVSHTVENISNSDITEGNITNSNISGGNASLDSLTVDSNTLVVDAENNRVGIATSSPFATLSVAGDFSLTGGFYDSSSSKGVDGYVLQSTGTGTEWVATSSLGISGGGGASAIEDLADVSSMTESYGDLLYWNGTSWGNIATSSLGIATSPWTTNGSSIYYTTGNVGIGTTTPGQKLSVAGDILGNNIIGSYFTATSTTATSTFAGGLSVAGSSGLTVLQNGNIGIGTTTPSASLTINREILIQSNGIDAPFTIAHASDNTRPLFRVREDGNVGIGTVYPQYKFDINATGAPTTMIGAFNTSYDKGILIGLTPDAVASISGTNDGSPDNLILNYDGGNVGIGTTTPGQKLSVAGDILGNNIIGSYFTATSTTASSTFANGINLNTGCFAINGTCLTAGGGSSPWTTSGSDIYYTTGGVGIGTTTPAANLSVQGSSAVFDSGSGGDFRTFINKTSSSDIASLIFTTGGSTVGNGWAEIGTLGTNDLYFKTNPTAGVYTTRMLIQGSTGNVGIGTTTPGQKLSVAGDILGNNIIGSYFTATSTTATTTLAGGLSVAGTTGLTVLQNGSVGIGTASPAYKLDISSPSGTIPFNILQNAIESSYPSLGKFSTSGGDLGQFAAESGYMLFMGQASKGLKLSANGFSNRNSGIIIDTNNNVGIGTTPSTKLHIRGSVSGDVMTRLDNLTGGGRAVFQTYNNIGSVWEFSSMGSTYSGNLFGVARANKVELITNTDAMIGTVGSNFMLFGTNNTEVMRLTSGGNVGIGTTTPGQKLSVAGDILGNNIIGSYFTATSSSSGFQAVNLLGGATNLTVDANGNIIRDPSDRNLKENIETIDGALEKVMKLRGVSYEWKDKERFGDQKEIGVIAQEVEDVVPEVVSSGGEYKSVNIKNLVGLLIEAIKELVAKVDNILTWFKGDRLNIKNDVCVDDVCITKDQFKSILSQVDGNTNVSGGNTNTDTNTNSDSNTDENVENNNEGDSGVEQDDQEINTESTEDLSESSGSENNSSVEEDTEENVTDTSEVDSQSSDEESGSVGDVTVVENSEPTVVESASNDSVSSEQ